MKFKRNIYMIIKALQIILILPKIFCLSEKCSYDILNIEHNNIIQCDTTLKKKINEFSENFNTTKINYEIKYIYCKECLKKRKNKNRLKYCNKCPALEILNSLNILSPGETLDEIINNKKSISRYGDGEFDIIFDKNIGFQKIHKDIKKRLIDILNSNEEGLVIGLINSFKYSYLANQKDESAKYWIKYINKNKYKLIKFLDINKKYGSSYISRFYMIFKENIIDIPKFLKKLKMIWDEKDIVIIEGEKTRLGVGNDLFNNVNSIQRIICPAENAFAVYNKIYDEAIKIDKNKLFLISLGPTATILAYDLYKAGYQAIDIGHVDIEYEWYLRKATNKIKIENKYVNEVHNGKINITDVTDPKYYSQIIVKILK